jgi:hypothetical protein
MSEYQYYEWQTIDRPLTEAELVRVRKLSSHMEVVTSTQAIVTYSWSDFKHDPRQVLLDYFDAFLYQANWGSQRLMFRFPKDVLDTTAIQPYLLEEVIILTHFGEYDVLDIDINDEEGYSLVKAEGALGQMTPLRDQIIRGDYRLLYLAWLRASTPYSPHAGAWDGDEDEYDEEEQEPVGVYGRGAGASAHDGHEPPVPPGLGALTGSLQRFIEVFDVDTYLVQAAAQASPAARPEDDEGWQSALGLLTRAECEAFLRSLLRGEPQVGNALRKRLIELAGVQRSPSGPPRRTIGELVNLADRLEEEGQQRAKFEAERQRIADLEALAKRENSAWSEVKDLIEQQKAGPYAAATALLVQLRDLAIYKKDLPAFERRFAEIRARVSSTSTLMARFKKAGLMG